MYALPSVANTVQVRDWRSWNGLPTRLSIRKSGLSCKTTPLGKVPFASYELTARRPGKSQLAPPLAERKMRTPLLTSGSWVVPAPRLNTWHCRNAVPLLSNATVVSPPACQYSRALLLAGVSDPPRTKSIGAVVPFQVCPPLRL